MSNSCRVNRAVQNTTSYSSLHLVSKGGGNATARRLASTRPPRFPKTLLLTSRVALTPLNSKWQMPLQSSHVRLQRAFRHSRKPYPTLIIGRRSGNPKERKTQHRFPALGQLEAWGKRNASQPDALQSVAAKGSVQVCWLLPCQINVSVQLKAAREGQWSRAKSLSLVADRV